MDFLLLLLCILKLKTHTRSGRIASYEVYVIILICVKSVRVFVLLRNWNHCVKRITMTTAAAATTTTTSSSETAAATASKQPKGIKIHTTKYTHNIQAFSQTHAYIYTHEIAAAIMIHKATRTNTLYSMPLPILCVHIYMYIYMAVSALFVLFRFAHPLPLILSLARSHTHFLDHIYTLSHSFIRSFIHSLTHSLCLWRVVIKMLFVCFF